MNPNRYSLSTLQALSLAVCVLGVLSKGAPSWAADAPATAPASVKVTVGHNDGDHANKEFKFKEVPSPVTVNAATKAKIAIVDGEQDGNGAGVEALNDGKLPTEEDQPEANFFFNAGTDGGRLVIDLGAAINVKQVNTYSWHTDARAPQVYTLYAADGTEKGFDAKTKDADPVKAGWKLVAKVDTRPKTGDAGGQYGVSISDKAGVIGKYRYLLMAVVKTEDDDNWGNTFYSEINVIDADAKPTTTTAPETQAAVRGFKEMSADYRALVTELLKDGPLPNYNSLTTAEAREKFAARMKDPLVKMAALEDEMAASNPGQMLQTPPGGTVAWMQSLRINYLSMASSLGSEAATTQLAALADSGDKEVAVEGKMGQFMTAWLLANKDEVAQAKVLHDIAALAKDNPASNALALGLRTIKMVPGQSADLGQRIDDIFTKTLTSEAAKGMQAVIDAGAKQKAATGKPFVLAGKTMEGKDFSTADYKGKVVLIDFWATWCGPCIAELPRVKDMYAKYHEKGLEIVGVSCDGNGEKLASYTKDNGMPWVQLWDKDKQGTQGKTSVWHALASEWKVNGIPQMFLIDRNGVLRTVEARAEMEKLIPVLIDEKVK